jgi:ribosome-binding protein aMBF1 (putative translation factor)
VSCEVCGGGDMWIKTCLTTDGSRLLVCDECYEENASVMVIVPGDRVVMARCDYCWRYGATLAASWRSAQAAARTPTRERAERARRRSRDEAGGRA